GRLAGCGPVSSGCGQTFADTLAHKAIVAIPKCVLSRPHFGLSRPSTGLIRARSRPDPGLFGLFPVDAPIPTMPAWIPRLTPPTHTALPGEPIGRPAGSRPSPPGC